MTADTKDIQAVERLGEQLAAALNNGDISSVDELAAPDAVLLAPAQGMVRGAQGVVGAWRSMSVRYSGLRFLPTVIEPLGDEVLLEVGTFSARPKRPGEERVIFKYQFVWHKGDGGWKLASMVWNRPAGERAGGADAKSKPTM